MESTRLPSDKPKRSQKRSWNQQDDALAPFMPSPADILRRRATIHRLRSDGMYEDDREKAARQQEQIAQELEARAVVVDSVESAIVKAAQKAGKDAGKCLNIFRKALICDPQEAADHLRRRVSLVLDLRGPCR